MRSWRFWLFWILIAAFLWLVFRNLSEVERLARTLSQGKWQWLALAAILQGAYYLAYTGIYQSAFHTVEVESRIRSLLPVVFGALFVNVVTPVGGAAGAALFIDDAAQRGQSRTRTAAGTLLTLVADFSTFAVVLAAGLFFLFRFKDLKTYEIIASLILLLLTVGLATVLLLGLISPVLLRGLLRRFQHWTERLLSRIHRPSPLSEDWAEHTGDEYIAAAAAIHAHPARLARTLGVAFLAHLIDMLSLYVIFLAFDHRAPLNVLVAGYAVGILFWIVSITPQGIGVVETMMTLTYSSLGVPVGVATAVAFSFRALTFWLPLAIGFVLLRRTKTFGFEARPGLTELGVRLIAVLTGLMGLINVLSAVTPALASRISLLEQFSPLAVRHGSHLATALAGFALMLLASSLWRRKRVAWLLAITVLGFSIFGHLLKGLDYEEAVLAGGLILWLLALRAQYTTRSDPPSIRQGLRTLAAAFGFTLLYGTLGFYLLDRHFKVSFGLGAALRQTLVMFTQFSNPGLEPLTGFGRYFATSIYAIAALTLGFALWMLVRPVLARPERAGEVRQHARQIIESYGRSSLATLALLPDKVYSFTPGGSVIPYVVKGRVALTLGDPIGPAQDLSAAIAHFQSLVQKNDWQPAFYQTLPDTKEVYLQHGFDVLKIGDEAIVDLARFTLQGNVNKGLRSGYNRILHLGYCAQVVQPPLPDDLLRELEEVSQEWLASVHGTEKRFSLGWFTAEYIRSCPVIIVQQPGAEISAFANITSEFTRSELSIDLMRHRKNALPGTMDFLFVSLFSWARENGYATFNLGLSALAGVGDQPADPAIEKMLHFVYEHVNQFYNFKGLHAFKEKFHPDWSPRYLIYPGVGSLPAVAAALLLADSGSSPITRSSASHNASA